MSLSVLGKMQNILELTSQQSFPKFILLQGVTQRLFYTVLGKILQKVFKKCLIGKEKLIRLNTLVFHAKFQRWQLKMLKSLFRLFPTLETRKGVLLKQEYDCTKTSQSLPPDEKSLLQAIKCILCHVYDWSGVDEAIISDILLQDSGQIVNNDNKDIHPLWLTGTFLISSQHFRISQQISYHLPLERFEKNSFSCFHS